MDAAENIEETDPGDDPTAAGMVTPPGGVVYQANDLIEAISKRVKADLLADHLAHGGGGGGGTPPEPPKTILGDTPKGWGTWLLRAGFASLVAIFAWYTYVNDSLEDRPTKAEAAEEVKLRVHEHQSYEHRNVEANTRQIKALSDIQIRQTIILENQTETLAELKNDLKQHRNSKQHRR